MLFSRSIRRQSAETTFDPFVHASSLVTGPLWVLVRPGTKVYLREIETWPSHYRGRFTIPLCLKVCLYCMCVCVCLYSGKKDKSKMDDY